MGGCSLRAHGSHSELPAVESLDNLDYIRYLSLSAHAHCDTELTYSGNEMVKHLLNIADRRQILTKVLDSMSNLVLHSKRLDAGPERTTDGQLRAGQNVNWRAHRLGVTFFLTILVFAPPHPPLYPFLALDGFSSATRQLDEQRHI